MHFAYVRPMFGQYRSEIFLAFFSKLFARTMVEGKGTASPIRYCYRGFFDRRQNLIPLLTKVIRLVKVNGSMAR